jgi:hypothetical protein
MSWVSWAFTVEGFFKDALNEVLQLESILNRMNFDAAMKVGANLE